MKYNHAIDLAFSIVSEEEDWAKIPIPLLREALIKRIKDLDDYQDGYQWEEALSCFDTYEVDEKGGFNG